ncbi:PREDICTED: putative F-box protein At3g23950 [Camelina sativa]|uniref:F-box protein At3g23950 n=1 Tax=Camelina sativa TaxID=90675 RepID=A0ABM0ZBL2_CAMSA|nr:PREDICTED: putative F-box protein At3g23950 [Camelina sativa]
MNIPEVAFVVLVRLPLKSIARFRSVCKEWKDLIDSDFFRDQFISRNSSSSISWSIIQMQPYKLTLEIMGHHGCKTWGLARSLGSFMSFFVETAIKKLLVLACTDGLVLLYAEATDGTPMYYVGNPLFQEWFPVPFPPFLSLEDLERLRLHERFRDTGLVTKMQSGIVVSYKVVLLMTHGRTKVDFAIYSSDTAKWENRNVTCPKYHWLFRFSHRKSIALNGMLHWFSNISVCFMAYDFYEGNVDDGCHIISFPDRGKDDEIRRFRRSFTTSEGSIVYFNEFRENENRTLRVWRLVKYTDGPEEAWQLLWEVSLVSMIDLLGIDYFPVVMHPLNSEIIYLWSRNKKGMVLFNLRTLVLSLHKENEDDGKCRDGCLLSFNRCSEFMENICGYFFPWSNYAGFNNLIFSQYVLPRWLHRLPRPPPT